jgi:hypothetical protein
VREDFNIDLPLTASFEAQTIAKLAERIEAAQRAQNLLDLPRVSRDGDLTITQLQAARWHAVQQALSTKNTAGFGALLEKLSRRGAALRHILPNIGSIVLQKLANNIDLEETERRLIALGQRFELLRAIFYAASTDTPTLRITNDFTGSIAHVQIDNLDAEAFLKHVAPWLAAIEQKPTRLERAPLFYVLLGGTANSVSHIALSGHPTLFDARSLHYLLEQIILDDPARPADSPLELVDYAAHLHRQNSSEQSTSDAESRLRFWTTSLSFAAPLLALSERDGAITRPRAALPAEVGTVIDTARVGRIKAAALALGVSHDALMLALYRVTLHKITLQSDPLVCMPVDLRPASISLPILGPFDNLLALRSALALDASFAVQARQAEADIALGRASRDVPFEQAAQAAEVDLALAQACLTIKRDASQASTLSASRWERISRMSTTIHAVESCDEWPMLTRFDDVVLDAVTINKLHNDFLSVIDAACSHPDHTLVHLAQVSA